MSHTCAHRHPDGAQMHTQHHTPSRPSSPSTERALGALLAALLGLTLAELLAQWAMGTGVI